MSTTTAHDSRSDSRSVSRAVVVHATPEQVFTLLAEPRRHPDFDGSGSVKAAVRGPQRLSLGAHFGMRMRIGLPYLIRNTVVEFEENRRIAWRHFGHHIWRYELEPVDGGTKVTESFVWGTALTPRALELAGVPQANTRAIEKTLERLRRRFATT